MRLGLIYILFLFVSCGTNSKLSKTEVEENPRPDWAYNRPINGSYYIGIGSANKLSFPSDYSIIAKKNALTDMSSEITVQVSGESFYHTIDRNKEYSEEFQSMIQSNFSEEITDYEIVDSWENEREFWIFTRISKTQHSQVKANKKQKILDQAYTNYEKALEYSGAGRPADALDVLSNALFSMKSYWAESNLYFHNEKEVHLDNMIYNEIRDICSALEMKTSSSKVTLDYLNGYASELSVALKKEGQYLSGIPVNYKFSSNRYSRPKALHTNSDGLVTIYVEYEKDQKSTSQLDLWIDFEELLRNDNAPEMSSMLISSINSSKVTVPISVVLPSVFFNTMDPDDEPLAKTIKNELQKNGFSVVNSSDAADLELSLSSTSKQGGQAQGFQVVFLDLTLVLEDHRSHRQLFSDSYTNIKGIHMNTNGAQGDAINKRFEKNSERNST